MFAIFFLLMCLTSSFINAERPAPLESLEISKITMDIWNRNWCGSNYGPYIEIESQNGEKRHTHFQGPFSKGERLIWDDNGENRWGAMNLGRVAGFQVKTFVEYSVQPDDARVYWYYIKPM